MTLWRLEWVRLTRTGRILILLAVFFSMGIIGPLTVRYLPELLDSAGGGQEVIVQLPPVSPEFAMASFLSNAIQLGLLAIAFVGAAALAIDAKPEISVFFRSRATIRQILFPRFVMTAGAAVVAFTVGVITAVVVSGVLIDWPDAASTIVASSLVALYLVFAVAVIALFGSLVRRVPATALLTIGVLTEFLTFMTILQQPVRQLGMAVNAFARASTSGARSASTKVFNSTMTQTLIP